MKRYSAGSLAWVGTLGVCLGGAAGFALGLLLAPEEGTRLRRRLLYQVDHLAGQVGTLAGPSGRIVDGSEARRTGDALVADAQERAQRIRDDIDALMRQLRAPAKRSSSSASR